jgi:amino acid adenylation domain-containing protein
MPGRMEFLLGHLLSNTAARHPEKEAVRMNGVALTYRELEHLTNRVARALQSAGVRRGDRVGIYVHKSFASIISVFGILKAGAVYVPLDPNAPARRLAYITRDCDIRVVLTSEGRLKTLQDFFAEGTPLTTVLLMEETKDALPRLDTHVRLVPWEETQAVSDEPLPPVGAIESDLAYILYTSGSTGVPKGVMISHRTTYTFINWSVDKFSMGPSDRVTSHAPLHFDLSTFDIFATIKAGGTIVLIPERLSTFPAQISQLLQDESVTITYLVPSILSLMVNYGNLGKFDFSSLRAVLFAGEVFPVKYLRKLVAAIPRAAYYNLYGPTETNVCTYYRVQQQDLSPDLRDRPLPIGKACENMEVFAVNDEGKLITAPGQEGELWARGSCVAQGYWGDADKTARSFVPNPFQPLFHEIAYRTGDIVTLAPDGANWLYVDRRDHMIKSRGYRIELGEIEAALYKHEKVKEAAAVAIPDDIIGHRIRAFVVASDGNGLNARTLEAFCAERLPKYMLPERIELRDSLPKTSTGKIDRAALVSASS